MLEGYNSRICIVNELLAVKVTIAGSVDARS